MVNPPGDPTPAPDAAQRYLQLLKDVLTRSLFVDEELTPIGFVDWRRHLVDPVKKVLATKGVSLVRPVDPALRAAGRDWPTFGETMIGPQRLDNLQQCVEAVLRDDVPGDLVETGVWRGGASILMRAVLAAYGDPSRRVWLADSFAGLPAPDVERFPDDADLDLSGASRLAVGVEQVKENFRKYDLLDDRVEFLVGWFKDTLPTAPIDAISVLRLDGDYYESTWQALEALYPKLSVGGFLIVDDYGGIEACAKAVHDYRDQHGITEEIIPIDTDGVYWRRTTA